MVEGYEWLAPLTFHLVGKELIFWQCMLDVRDEFYPFVRIETSLSRGTKFVPKNVIFLNRRDLEKQRKANFNSLGRFNLAQAVLSCYRFDPCSWGELPAFFYDYFCRFNFFNWMLFLGMNSYINLGNLDPFRPLPNMKTWQEMCVLQRIQETFCCWSEVNTYQA